eukprot:TRINITY_DN242_c2_g1_i1.p1 TRINITY_DN242_c2_g1~~TRINITY_DN242_c2_g1_i1.p1  ORF type:complete len:766 (-),score=263.58 TRINITY_DN242_c2_g1_i1:75-2372(-)
MSKDAIVVVLDVGTTMSEGGSDKLSNAIKSVQILLQQKMLFSKKDEVGIVLFGTKDTVNDLSEEGYENITVLQGIQPPDIGSVRELEGVEPEGVAGDFVDAIIVAMDMLIHHTSGKKYEKRVFLITDAGCAVNQADFSIVLDKFKEMECSLNVLGIDFADRYEDPDFDENEDEIDPDEDAGKSETKKANEKLLFDCVKSINADGTGKGNIYSIHNAIEMMSQFRSMKVLQRPVFTGMLELGELQIPVTCLLKTRTATFPTMTKVSVIAEQTANPGSTKVLMERSYASNQDPDTELTKDELIKGFKYGKSLVSVDPVSEDMLKLKGKRELIILGFTRAENVPRQHHMGQAEIIQHNPKVGGDEAGQALSALARALHETNSVAIVRFVKRANAAPHLGFLAPMIKIDFEGLAYNKLPFCEDLRQYQFASLDPAKETTPKSCRPNEKQLQAAESLINSLDLMGKKVVDDDDDEDEESYEKLKARHTYNPSLQRFYQAVVHRALHPNEPLQELDPVIRAYVEPDGAMFGKAAGELALFKNAFVLTAVNQDKDGEVEGKKRKVWSDHLAEMDIELKSYHDGKKRAKVAGGDDIAGGASVKSEPDDDMGIVLEKLVGDSAEGKKEIGSVDPVSDFKEILLRKDQDLVPDAISDMEKMIRKLVNDSVRDQLYPKAIECLVTLRTGCVQEGEPTQFNDFLRSIRANFEGKRRDAFWTLVAEKRQTLISTDECDDSKVDQYEADQFLQQPQESKPVAQAEEEEEEDDDLFAMAE